MTFEEWVERQTNSPIITRSVVDEQTLKEKRERAIVLCEAFITRLQRNRRKGKDENIVGGFRRPKAT